MSHSVFGRGTILKKYEYIEDALAAHRGTRQSNH